MCLLPVVVETCVKGGLQSVISTSMTNAFSSFQRVRFFERSISTEGFKSDLKKLYVK